jgi:hypothetical protein
MKYNIWWFFEILSGKFKFDWNLTRITATLREDLCAFVIPSCRFILKLRNVSYTICKENQNTHFIFNNSFPTNVVPLWANVENYGTAGQATDLNVLRRMRYACRIIKARMQTHCHSISCLLLHNWLIPLNLVKVLQVNLKTWITTQQRTGICHHELL